MPTEFFTSLASEPLPRRIEDRREIAVVRTLLRARHIEATFDLVDGEPVGTVHGLTVLGRKVRDCLQCRDGALQSADARPHTR